MPTPASSPGASTDTSTGTETCSLCGGAGFVRHPVPFGHPDFGQAFPCQCQVKKGKKAGLWQEMGGPGPELLKRMTFDKFDRRGELPPEQRQNLEQALRLAREFAKEPEGWLVFLGVSGCGKTHLATAIANHRLAQGQAVSFASIHELLDHLRSAYSPEAKTSYDDTFEGVKKAPLLILDNLGAHSTSPWAEEKLFQIINYRYNNRVPTLFTSHKRLEEIVDQIASRMGDPGLSIVFFITAPMYAAPRPAERPHRRLRPS